METLPSSTGGPKLPEKIARWAPIVAIGAVAFYFWGQIVPFVESTMHNTALALAYGIPSAIVLGALILYPTFWWMQYKNIVHWFMSLLIKMDPLSFMDRYVDILQEKLGNLNRIKVQLKGRLVESERRMLDLNKQVENSLKRGAAAKRANDLDTASLEGERARGAKESIDLFTPNHERLKKSVEFMEALSKNWGLSIIKLSEQVARKRQEYEVIRDQAAGLKEAEAFLNGDTPEGKIYQESLKALEYSVTQKIAYINDFEDRSKDIMAGIKVDNQMQHDEGLDMLNSYMKDDKLMLPTDFSAPVPKFRNTSMVQDVAYEDVKKDSFKLLD